MVGWHHWLNRHEFEQTQGDSEVQGSLACCHSWGCKEFGHDIVTEQQQLSKKKKKSPGIDIRILWKENPHCW